MNTTLAVNADSLMEEVRSPFLKGSNVQFAWDSTSLGYLKTCPRLYQYIMIEGYSNKEESIHLRFGIEYHQALQEYDLARAKGMDFDDALHHTITELHSRVWDWEPDRDTKAGGYKNRDSIFSVVVDYIDHFRDDPAKTLILDNGSPAVELSFRFELDWGPIPMQPYMLSGHLDRVVEFQDNLFVMDRKTTTIALGQYYFAQFEPNNQMTIYTLASQVVLDSPVKGVIIDAVQILKETPHRFVRGFTYRTEDQLQEWVDGLQYWFATAETYARENYWPMNDTACDKFGGCMFRGICSKSPQVRQAFLDSNFIKLAPEERWNPLKPR